MRALVLLNPSAGAADEGGSSGRERVAAAFATAGVEAEIVVAPVPELMKRARRAGEDGHDAVVAAGGDGTVSAVAAVLVGGKVPLGVLPEGTLNHFAKDAGLPPDTEGAARIIAAGHTRAVDVGEVNGRFFINNSSIGLYPQLVRHRDEQRERLGRGKWPAMVIAILAALRRIPRLRVRLHTPEGTFERTTPFVFVGNNPYAMAGFTLGERPRLDLGTLSLYVTRRTGRFALLRLAVRKMAGRLDSARDFDTLQVTETWVHTGHAHLDVALDGEVVRMSAPLHYRIRPGALRVFVPAGGSA